MRRILIDISSLAIAVRQKRPIHGIPRVTLAYLNYYFEHLQVFMRIRGRVYIFSQHRSQEIVKLMSSWDSLTLGKLIRLLLKSLLFSRTPIPALPCVVLKIDHGSLEKPAYLATFNQANIPVIAVVHDLFPITRPEFCSPEYTLVFAEKIKALLDNVQGVINVSDATGNDLQRYASCLNKKCPPQITALLAPGIDPAPLSAKKLINTPYFVTIGTIGSRKNHLLLLNVWRALVNKLGANAPKLVIIGKRSTRCWATTNMLDRCPQLKDSVIERQSNDDEMIQYLYHAKALLFPTFGEGYGLPLIEALSMNVPVIASDLPVFHEIAQDIPEYLDPMDGTGWLEMIENYSQEHSLLRLGQLNRMSHFQAPTWTDHFSKVDAFIKETVCNSK